MTQYTKPRDLIEIDGSPDLDGTPIEYRLTCDGSYVYESLKYWNDSEKKSFCLGYIRKVE